MPQQIIIEQINLLDLPSMPLAQRNNFPAIPCVYFVVSAESQVAYVGRTTNLKTRWVSHHRYEEIKLMQNTSVAWIEVTDVDTLPEIEQLIIDYFNPPLNGKMTAIVNQVSAISISPDRVDKAFDRVELIVGQAFDEVKSRFEKLKNKNAALEKENRKLKDTVKQLTAIINNLSE
ncbi:GIY-YIG nuclease family protein [Nostoc sp.]|uniref:GIY-YIG nuclease family protein n=1 Tax=Nostoc sp. TaxID=1180 RepID=UPI002FF7759A